MEQHLYYAIWILVGTIVLLTYVAHVASIMFDLKANKHTNKFKNKKDFWLSFVPFYRTIKAFTEIGSSYNSIGFKQKK